MMPLSIFTTTEFYVTVLVVAAAVLAYAAMPASAGAVRQHLVGSSLGSMGRCAPGIEVECLGGGDVVISRRGLDGVFPDGAVSAAVSVKGFDVTVEERVVCGKCDAGDGNPDTAVFRLGFLAEGQRYHLRYVSDAVQMSVSLVLHNGWESRCPGSFPIDFKVGRDVIDAINFVKMHGVLLLDCCASVTNL